MQPANTYTIKREAACADKAPCDVNVTISFLGRDGTVLSTGVRWPLELVQAMFGPNVHCRFSNTTGWYYYAEVRL